MNPTNLDRQSSLDMQANSEQTATSESAANSNSQSTSIGRHVLLDLYGICDARLSSETALREWFVRLLDDCGFHRLGVCSHQFPGENAGATVVVLLSESHASIHTYPERDYAAVDVFSCGQADLDAFVEQTLSEWKPARFDRLEKVRGQSMS